MSPETTQDQMLEIADRLEAVGDAGIDQLTVQMAQDIGELRSALTGAETELDLQSAIHMSVTRALRENSPEVRLEVGSLLSRIALNPRESRDDRGEALEGLTEVSQRLSGQVGYLASAHPDSVQQQFALSVLVDLDPALALARAQELIEHARTPGGDADLLPELQAVIEHSQVAAAHIDPKVHLAAEILYDPLLTPVARMDRVLDIQAADRELAAAVLAALTRTGEDELGQRAQEQGLHLLALDRLSGMDLGLALVIAPSLPESDIPNSFPNRLLQSFWPLE